MKPLLHDLFHRHIGTAFNRQVRLADLCRERGIDPSWNYTVSTAELTLGGKWVLTAPLAGSHAEDNNTWLWAWANRHLQQSAVRHELQQAVTTLTEQTGFPMFAKLDALNVDELFGEEVAEQATHAMGAVLCGLLGYDAYYTIPYTGGRGLAVMQVPELRTPDPLPVATLTSRFTQLVSAMSVPNHRSAFVGFATDLGLTLSESDGVVRGRHGGVEVLTAEFDHLNRLTELKSALIPQT